VGVGDAPLAEGVPVHLAKAEQIEVVDEERREHDDEPAEAVTHPQRDSADTMDRPHNSVDRAPLPEHQGERRAGGEHVGAPFERCAHQASPALEPPTSHHAVLRREQPEQSSVDRDRSGGVRSVRTAVDGVRDPDVGEKGDGIQRDGDEADVSNAALEDGDDPTASAGRVDTVVEDECDGGPVVGHGVADVS
jgi:hypothetical protein